MSPLRSRNATAAPYALRPTSNGAAPAAVNGAKSSKVKPELNGAAISRSAFLAWPEETRIGKILKLIESEPARSIHDLAALLNLSRSHLQHLFKQQTGVQLGHLLLEQRLLKAAYLLENSTMSVKEIAYTVGYEHTSSFIRAFERRFAIAPRSYRQQNGRNGF